MPKNRRQMLMADNKTTKMPEQPGTDIGLDKETSPERKKTPTPSEVRKGETAGSEPTGVRLWLC